MNFCQQFLEFVQKTVTTATDAHFIFEYDARRKAISARHAAAEEMPRSLLPRWYTEAMSKPVWRLFASTETRHFIFLFLSFQLHQLFLFLNITGCPGFNERVWLRRHRAKMSDTTEHGVKVLMATLATVQANVMDSIHDTVPTFPRLGSVSCVETVWNWCWKNF
jgi:hypothetical protein